MATAQTIVDSALRKVKQHSSGQTPSLVVRTDALETLNDLLGIWSTENLLIPYRTSESFSLISGVSSRTIGASGDFATVRPLEIESIYIRDSSNYDHYLTEIKEKRYSEIELKTTEKRPTRFYYEPSFPNGTIYFNGQTADTETIYIVSRKQLNEFISLSTDVDLPSEYVYALKVNLALKLAHEIGDSRAVHPDLYADAERSKDLIKTRNLLSQINELRVDGALLQRGGKTYNINED